MALSYKKKSLAWLVPTVCAVALVVGSASSASAAAHTVAGGGHSSALASHDTARGDNGNGRIGDDNATILTQVVSAVRGPDGITITGWAPPGARLKTTNDPDYGWFDPEGGITYATADGSFTLVTKRTIAGVAVVESFDPKTGEVISGSPLPVIPQAHIDSAVRGSDGTVTITGWALPGARMKTTNDPQIGWYDPEGRITYAKRDGSFTLVTSRSIDGQAEVKSYDPNTGEGISDSNRIPVTSP
ncbi:hypothetical protein O159_24660 [Leifsonia xyli subsp. cynodontis DSM 46306]|uniref:Uncharacterized protein n=1 Tax=Leifsonia xyli subsp. cynodontis DSM 46306 TaxID=1389489 RepID=U3P805_LEIXC|nr:hypothetical protein [Leifsonia xyli]AGW42405.1 hypothetical protein O159_24660 [Leifsonia xyli subsp. cynodontis DSM 46306]